MAMPFILALAATRAVGGGLALGGHAVQVRPTRRLIRAGV